LPGEYRVNFRNGADKTARFADDLNQALEIGREMAAEAATIRVTAKRPPRRRRWRKRMTPKGRRRRLIKQHNRRRWARRSRENRDSNA